MTDSARDPERMEAEDPRDARRAAPAPPDVADATEDADLRDDAFADVEDDEFELYDLDDDDTVEDFDSLEEEEGETPGFVTFARARAGDEVLDLGDRDISDVVAAGELEDDDEDIADDEIASGAPVRRRRLAAEEAALHIEIDRSAGS